jgi:hypothetical protein
MFGKQNLFSITFICLTPWLLALFYTAYQFAQSNQPYTYLSESSSLTSGKFGDDTAVVLPVRFNFKFWADSYAHDSVLFCT